MIFIIRIILANTIYSFSQAYSLQQKKIELIRLTENMKGNAISLMLFFAGISLTGQPHHTYEITGVASGEEIVESLKIAIPLILIGLFIAWLFMWRHQDSNDGSTGIGCLGILIMGAGFFCLIPLFSWLEFGFGVIITILGGIAIIYYLIKALFK